MQQLWRINMATAKCVETTGESDVYFAKHSPGEMKTRPSIAQNITTARNQTAAMNCHTYIAPFTMEWRLVSCLWRLRLPTPVGLLCQFECRSHQAHRCMLSHFRPPVTLSTVSWFCCRSRCRPVSSWCRVSLLPLELRRPSARTQSLWKLPSPPRRLFQLVTKASQHLYTTLDPHWWLCTLTQGPKLDTNLHDETHMPLTFDNLIVGLHWKLSATSHIGKQAHECHCVLSIAIFYNSSHHKRI